MKLERKGIITETDRSVYVCVIYIYTYRERERERESLVVRVGGLKTRG